MDEPCRAAWRSRQRSNGPRFVGRLRADWPQLDLLVNNAGIGVQGNIGECPIDDWRHVVDVDLFGAIYGCHFCRDWLVANPEGSHVINVASAAAFFNSPGMGPYSVSKAGILSLSETLYAELRPRGVGVSVVCPGFFPTNVDRRMPTFKTSESEAWRGD